MDRSKQQSLVWTGLPPVLTFEDLPRTASSRELRSGDLCPHCKAARLDYDGLLNLSCPQCGYAAAGCST